MGHLGREKKKGERKEEKKREEERKKKRKKRKGKKKEKRRKNIKGAKRPRWPRPRRAEGDRVLGSTRAQTKKHAHRLLQNILLSTPV